MDLPPAKTIVDDIAEYCPYLLEHSTLFTPRFSETLAGITGLNDLQIRQARRTLLAHLNNFASEMKLSKFVDDLENDPFRALVQGRVEVVKAWEKLYPHANRTSIPILTRRVEFEDLPSQWRKENPYNIPEEFIQAEKEHLQYIFNSFDERGFLLSFNKDSELIKVGKGIFDDLISPDYA